MSALSFRAAILFVASLVCLAPAAAQDTRTVTEPSFPPSCAVLTAQLSVVNNDLAAASENSFDTARIQGAIDSCPAGQAVELAPDELGHNAFLIQPISIATGVTLLVDAGVTVFASRNPRDYDLAANSCGIVASSSAGCRPVITISGTSNTGIMGFGKIDGRGGDPLLGPGVPANTSWWDLASQAQQLSLTQFVPRLIVITNSNNVTLYKITLKNSPMFHVAIGGLNGFTVWGIKIVTPYTARNSDGIDANNSQNVTIANNYISSGDDEIAVGSSNTNAHNISILNNHLYDGHGVSIGSYTNQGVTNMLVDHVMMAGNTADSNSNGIRIKSANDRGGTMSNITYQNMCIQNVKHLLLFDPKYNTNPGTLIPNFQSIFMNNIHFLTRGSVELDGADAAHPLGLTMNNVIFDSLQASDLTPAPLYANITLGPGPVSSNLVNNLSGTGVTVTNNISNSNAPFDCTNAFVYLAGELTSRKPLVNGGQVVNLIALLQPTMAGAPMPTGTVQILEGATVVATGTLSGSSDMITIALTNVATGTHTYTANYLGDGKYAALAFGSYTATVNPGSAPLSQTALAGVPASASYGAAIPVTATVTGSGPVPTGSVEFLLGSTVVASVPLTGGTAGFTFIGLGAGAYTVSAAYLGDANFSASISPSSSLLVTPAATSTALSSSAAQVSYGNTATLTATVSSAAGIPPGTVTFFNGATQLGTAALVNGVAAINAGPPVGSYSITASYVATQNFLASTSNAVSLTVTPSAAATLSTLPAPLPYTISTFAGGGASATCSGSNSVGDGCSATQVLLTGTDWRGITVDPFGNVIFTDTNARIRKVNAITGSLSTIAGGATACSAKIDSYGDGCPATATNIKNARGVWADADNNVFIAGYGNHLIHKIQASDGKLVRVAGQLSGSTSSAIGVAGAGADGLAIGSALNQPRGVWTDLNGNVYIADTTNHKIRVVYTAGIIPNVAIPVTGNIYTLTGSGTAGSSGDGAVATAATVNNPQGGVTDVNGNVFIADSSGGRIRVIYMAGDVVANLIAAENPGVTAQVGFIYTVAGTGATTAGTTPILAKSAKLSTPQKLVVDAAGNMYISDSQAIWFLDMRSGYLRRLVNAAGTPCAGSNAIGDGCPAATGATFGIGTGGGIGLALDRNGNLYFSDTLDQRIRKVSTNAAFSPTAAGSTLNQTMQVHFIAGDSQAAANGFTLPSGLLDYSIGAPACTTNSDTTTDCTLTATFSPTAPGFRKAPLTITSTLGNVARIGLSGTGQGAAGALDPAVQLTIGSGLTPQGVAVDAAQNVYVADAASHRVLKYAPGSTSPLTLAAGFTSPRSLALDAAGNVYVADSGAGTVQRIAGDGTVTSVGSGLISPTGVAVDSNGNIYIADSGQTSIIQVAPGLAVQNRIGSGFTSPSSVAVDATFNVYVADPAAGTVTKVTPAGVSTVVATTATVPTAVAVDAAGNLYVADAGSLEVLLVPASTGAVTGIYPNLQTPRGLAVDGVGNVYLADAGLSTIVELERTQGAISFADSTTTFNATLSSIGNQPITPTSGGFTRTDTTDFNLSTAGTGGCNFAAPIAPGAACTLLASFTPQVPGPLTDVATLTGNYSNLTLAAPQALQLTLTGSVAAATVFTQVPATGTAGTPLGSVVVQVQDPSGRLLAGSTAAVTLGSTPAGVGGTLTTSAVNGVATFNNVVFAAGGTFTLQASSPGLTGGTSGNIAIATPVTIATTPAGLSITVDGGLITTPMTLNWAPGSSHTLAAPATVPVSAGTRYALTGWSQGGAASQTITVPTSATTYTAAYQTQYYLTTTVTGSGILVPGSGWFNAGATVTVTATPAAGNYLTGFSGALSGTTNPQNLTMNGPASVTASFASGSAYLTAAVVSKADGTLPNERVWTVRLTDTGAVTATNAAITSVKILGVTGTATVTLSPQMTLPVAVGTIAPGASASGQIRLIFPATTPVSRISIQIGYAADGGVSGQTTFNSQFR